MIDELIPLRRSIPLVLGRVLSVFVWMLLRLVPAAKSLTSASVDLQLPRGSGSVARHMVALTAEMVHQPLANAANVSVCLAFDGYSIWFCSSSAACAWAAAFPEFAFALYDSSVRNSSVQSTVQGSPLDKSTKSRKGSPITLPLPSNLTPSSLSNLIFLLACSPSFPQLPQNPPILPSAASTL
jgi:hypothetical protein